MDNKEIGSYMRIKLDGPLPSMGEFDPSVRRAPKRESDLSESDVKLALRNALRYIPEEYHAELAPEFYQELMERGKIYGYRTESYGGAPLTNIKANAWPVKPFRLWSITILTSMLHFTLMSWSPMARPVRSVKIGCNICSSSDIWKRWRKIKRWSSVRATPSVCSTRVQRRRV